MTNPLTDQEIAKKLQWYTTKIETTAQSLEQQEPFSEDEKAGFFKNLQEIKRQLSEDRQQAKESGQNLSEFIGVLTAIETKLPTKETDEENLIGQTYKAYEEIAKVYGHQRKQQMLNK